MVMVAYFLRHVIHTRNHKRNHVVAAFPNSVLRACGLDAAEAQRDLLSISHFSRYPPLLQAFRSI